MALNFLTYPVNIQPLVIHSVVWLFDIG